MVWQIILKDSPIILVFYSQNFSPLFFQTSPLFFHYQHNAASQKLVAMTCAFTFNPNYCISLHTAVCKVLQSSLCLFKVGISGYGNLRTMSTDKWATSKSTQLSTKVWVKLLLMRFCQCCVSYLDKADNFTYYSKSDAHHSHNNFQLVR